MIACQIPEGGNFRVSDSKMVRFCLFQPFSPRRKDYVNGTGSHGGLRTAHWQAANSEDLCQPEPRSPSIQASAESDGQAIAESVEEDRWLAISKLRNAERHPTIVG